MKFDKNAKAQITELFTNISLAFNPSLAEETRNLINAYDTEKSTQNHTITLSYSPFTAVDRVWDGETKYFYPKHKQEDKWIRKVGDINNWLPYRYSDIQYCHNQIAIINEGEKATDYARYHGLISFCFLGAKCQDEQFIENNLLALKGDLAGAIYIADNDDAGMKKAQLVQKVAKKINFPVLILPIKAIYPQAKKGDDLVEFFRDNSNLSPKIMKAHLEDTVESYLDALIKDYLTEEEPVESQKSKILSDDEAVSVAREILETEQDEIKLNTLLNSVRKRSSFSEYFWENKIIKPLKRESKHERLKLELASFLQESDPIRKIYLKQSICGNYSISNKDFEYLSNYIDNANSKPQPRFYSGIEFFEMPEEEIKWIIPGVIPEGELLLLSAREKVGKSLLVCDIAHAILEGGEVLGELAKKGKVLYIGSDESSGSLKRRMMVRGIDLLDLKNLAVIDNFDLTDSHFLEQKLEDFRPDILIMDSLTSITESLEISENDAKFARPIHKIRRLTEKYNTATIIIHHNNKKNEMAGSARIGSAAWGMAILTGGDHHLEEDKKESLIGNPHSRFLTIRPREGQKIKFKMLINPKDLWGEKGIYEFLGDADDPDGQKRTQGEQVINLLKAKGVPLEYGEIDDYLNIGRSLYMVLDRLVDRRLISKRRSHTNPRRFVYLIDNQSQQDCSKKSDVTSELNLSPLPSSNLLTDKKIKAELIENKEIEVSQSLSQQLVNTTESNKVDVNSSNEDIAKDSELVNNCPNNQEGGEVNDDLATQNDDNNYEKESKDKGQRTKGKRQKAKGFKEDKTRSAQNSQTPESQHTIDVEDERELQSSNSELNTTPYSLLSTPSKDCFIGLRVRHKDTPEMEGEIISELCKVDQNFMVIVQWLQPRPQNPFADIEELCWITDLSNDEIDFQKWTNTVHNFDL